MNTFTCKFGERFRESRKLAKLSQQKFGELLGVSRQTINAYENDRQRPTLDMMEKVCRQQGISPRWLLSGTGEMSAGLTYTAAEESGPAYAVAEERLFPEQRALMNFIATDPDRAKKLTQVLLDGGLNSLAPKAEFNNLGRQ